MFIKTGSSIVAQINLADNESVYSSANALDTRTGRARTDRIARYQERDLVIEYSDVMALYKEKIRVCLDIVDISFMQSDGRR
jgi:hypothetical protein